MFIERGVNAAVSRRCCFYLLLWLWGVVPPLPWSSTRSHLASPCLACSHVSIRIDVPGQSVETDCDWAVPTKVWNDDGSLKPLY